MVVYAASSGTSFAVPFAATAAARLRQVQPEANILQAMLDSAEDLGPPGRDRDLRIRSAEPGFLTRGHTPHGRPDGLPLTFPSTSER